MVSEWALALLFFKVTGTVHFKVTETIQGASVYHPALVGLILCNMV